MSWHGCFVGSSEYGLQFEGRNSAEFKSSHKIEQITETGHSLKVAKLQLKSLQNEKFLRKEKPLSWDSNLRPPDSAYLGGKGRDRSINHVMPHGW